MKQSFLRSKKSHCVFLQVQTELRKWLWKCHSPNHLTPAKRSITQITIRTRGEFGLPPSSANISSVWLQAEKLFMNVKKKKKKDHNNLYSEHNESVSCQKEHATTMSLRGIMDRRQDTLSPCRQQMQRSSARTRRQFQNRTGRSPMYLL